MILPLAILARSPMDEYQRQHDTLEAALKHNVSDALAVHNEIELLKNVMKYFNGETDKESKRLEKNLDLLIREKEERLFRLTKFSDYPALTMAAYPDSKFMSGHDYKRAQKNITDPILVRGISAGAYTKQAEATGRDFYFMESGYLGNYRSDNNPTGRKVYHRIQKNAMQQTRILDVPDDRWKQLVKFDPRLTYRGWRKKPGSKILLIMSSQKPFQFYNEDKDVWVKNTIDTIKKHSDREIVIREKAGRGERTNDTIYDALDDDIWAVVTYNSVAAVEAIQYGIPSFSMAPTAASMISTTDLSLINCPPKVDEEVVYKWLSSIAYGQYSIQEILTGQAWKMVLENDDRPTLDY